MKKVLALALALVMAFSMSAIAFATDDENTACQVCGVLYDTKEQAVKCAKGHTAATDPTVAPTVYRNVCPICGRQFAEEDTYNAHLEICDVKADGSETIMADFTIKEILNMIVELVKGSMGQWDNIEGVVIELIGFVEKIADLGVAAVSEAEVKGAVADLEAALADVKIPAIDELLNSLKQKIKDLYAGEVATTVEVVETTVIEKPSTTGSSSVGIALFAAVSVAAAAAYVCTKKSK